MALSAQTASLQRLFTLLVAEPRQDSWPDLAKVRLSGHARLSLSLEGAPDRLEAASGRLTLSDLSLSGPQGGGLRGLTLELPFDLDRRPSAPPPQRLEGGLRLAEIDALGLTGRDLSLKLSVAGDSLVVAQPLELGFWGGRLSLAGLRAERLSEPERTATLEGLRLRAPLAALTETLLGTHIEGDLTGELPSIVYGQGRWQATGRLAIENLFGGRMEVQGPWVADPLRAYRSLGADVAFEHVSLEALTGQLVGFGKMTGTVRGGVRGLELAYGQPAAFELEVASEKSGEPRRVSVQAVESISTIGTGTTAGLSGIFFNLFSEFRYSRLGLAASLHNDVFRLRGTIHEGGAEYLVRRSLLGGIDVVNRNPDNAIGFKDMRERVERIFGRQAQLR